MTPDVERESALLLEESHPTVEQGCRAHTGIARGKFMCAGPEERYSEMVDSHFKQDRLFYFDSPIPKPNQVYRIRVGWDPRGYRIWIDGEQMRLESGEIFPFEMPEKSFVGIDTLTIHPGMGGTRLTLSEQRRRKETARGNPGAACCLLGKHSCDEYLGPGIKVLTCDSEGNLTGGNREKRRGIREEDPAVGWGRRWQKRRSTGDHD